MLINSKSESEISNIVRTSLAAMGITNFGESSVATIVASIIASNYKELASALEEAVGRNDFRTASGTQLDNLAALFGIRRYVAARAYTNASERNFQLYVSSGTFGDLNGGNDIVLPAGTIFFYRSANSGDQIEYRLSEAKTLQAADSTTFASIEAVRTGKASNIAKGLISEHNTGYAIRATNNYPIINGRDFQSDEEIRYLISIAPFTRAACGTPAIRSIMASVQGVTEYSILPFYEGIGTTGIIIDFFDNSVSNQYVASVKNLMLPVVAAGENLIVERVGQIKVSFTLTVESTLSEIEVSSAISRAIREAFSETTIGTPLEASDLITILQDLDEVDSISGDAFTQIDLRYIDSDLNETSVVATSTLISCASNQKISLETDFLNLTVI